MPSVEGFYNYSQDPFYPYGGQVRLCLARYYLGQQRVSSLEDFQTFMHSNDYLRNESGCSTRFDPREAVAPRYDLCGPANCSETDGEGQFFYPPEADGATDAKVTQLALAKLLQFKFRHGPSRGHGETELPAFNFTAFGIQVPKGVAEVLPLPNAGFKVIKAFCQHKDDNCLKCVGDYEFDALKKECQPIDYTPIILALSIPLGVLLIGLIIWTIYFFRKPKYEKLNE